MTIKMHTTYGIIVTAVPMIYDQVWNIYISSQYSLLGLQGAFDLWINANIIENLGTFKSTLLKYSVNCCLSQVSDCSGTWSFTRWPWHIGQSSAGCGAAGFQDRRSHAPRSSNPGGWHCLQHLDRNGRTLDQGINPSKILECQDMDHRKRSKGG